MIGSLTGSIQIARKDHIILLVGDVGYKIFALTETLMKEPGKALSLYTYLAVREHALDLYGFESEDDLDMFELLLTVSGIGPKSALATLNAAGTQQLKRSVAAEDPALLSKMSGIGKKTAEKIVTELKGKLDTEDIALPSSNSTEAIDALVALGYSEKVARDALGNISADLDTKDMIKEALKHIH